MLGFISLIFVMQNK